MLIMMGLRAVNANIENIFNVRILVKGISDVSKQDIAEVFMIKKSNFSL